MPTGKLSADKVPHIHEKRTYAFPQILRQVYHLLTTPRTSCGDRILFDRQGPELHYFFAPCTMTTALSLKESQVEDVRDTPDQEAQRIGQTISILQADEHGIGHLQRHARQRPPGAQHPHDRHRQEAERHRGHGADQAAHGTDATPSGCSAAGSWRLCRSARPSRSPVASTLPSSPSTRTPSLPTPLLPCSRTEKKFKPADAAVLSKDHLPTDLAEWVSNSTRTRTSRPL